MESPTIIHFVRHGAVYNQSDVYYGRLSGFPLSEDGRHQASTTRDYLANKKIAAIYSSPRLRARETAQILLEPHKNILVTISELLDEVFSPFDGAHIEEVKRLNWNVYNHGRPGYEHPEDILARARRFIEGVRLGHCGQQVIAVTHGDPIAFLTLWVKGAALTPQNKQALYEDSLKPGSITSLSFHTKDNEFPQIGYVDPSQKK